MFIGFVFKTLHYHPREVELVSVDDLGFVRSVNSFKCQRGTAGKVRCVSLPDEIDLSNVISM